MRKNLFISILTMLFCINAFAQTATVTLSSQKQYIRGFGGINHPVWAGDLTATQRETAFGNGAGQMGMTVLRIWISDNKNDWSKELATAKRAIALGAIVFATPWNPPASMCETITRNNRQEKRLKPSSYGEYVNHLNEFNNYMKTNGVNIYALSFANEPDYGFDWTWYSADEVYNFTKNNASSLRINGTKVITAESFSYSKKMYDQILNDPAALANIDIIGCHFYASDANTPVTFFQYPLADQKAQTKERWMTEHYTNSDANSADIWPDALDVSYEMYRAMVEGQMSVYTWWYIRRQYGPMKEDGNISKRGYCFSQYSKFIRPGYYRVDATKNPTTDVYLSAYKKGDDVAIVAINRSTSSKTITISVPATKVKTWEKYVTSGSKSLAKEADINMTGTSFQVTLDAQSTTTFNGTAVVSVPIPPTVTLTAPLNNATYVAPASINIGATATDADGVISKVEFYNGTTKLGEDVSSPYTYSWSNVAAGTYSITAVATDNDGNKTTSAAVLVKVNVPRSPYKGVAHPIPGRIEAEEYDLGGEGVSFHEANTNGNEGGAVLRNDDVDIEATNDTDGAYNVGYVLQGEWLEYSVNVQYTEVYNLDVRVAADGTGKSFHIEMDGANVSGPIAVPNTGGWQTWQTVGVQGINLTAGEHIMRIVFDASYLNLNYVEFKQAVITGVESSTVDALKVYPNPFANEELHIKQKGSFNYRITDISGTLVEEGKGQEQQNIGTSLSRGVYLLYVESNEGHSIHKIVKQ
ncbi:MAG: carbohydrate-binding protein [Sporocytophaga sp.]|uniref:carbohydrate-binding protein n=1 Tax=Sporocytophaga sp. TaxID=2231183 RepID=UPI001B020826|nr:carbohydrate-binding protein [Sporocytophaga sp.]MBO9699057.1 carbohydrate-binding protein [Sporocytophaga sp.]